MKALAMVTLAVGITLGVAPPATADTGEYLDQLQPRISFLSADQLLTEGYKVCRFLSVGRPSGDAIPMVTKDLGITVAAAFQIVPAAVEHLDC
jgi:hypothetical protein